MDKFEAGLFEGLTDPQAKILRACVLALRQVIIEAGRVGWDISQWDITTVWA